MEPMEPIQSEKSSDTKVDVKWGPLSEFRYDAIKVRWKYPYHLITRSGVDNGFFIPVDKKPEPPSTLKHRTWEFVKGMDRTTGKPGYYVYVKQFGPKFDLEKEKFYE